MQYRPDFLPFGRPNYSDEEIQSVVRVMRTGWIGMGPEVQQFESEFASYVSAQNAVAVSSCTAALHLALCALGIGPGDEVVCPSLTWCSSANAALYLGAKVVFSDVCRETFCSGAAEICRCVTSRTKAVVVVHYGGFSVDVDELRTLLPTSIAIVEDAAHALGAKYPSGGMVGSSGNPVCFSFYANKNLSTAEGGAVACDSGDFVEQLKCLRQHGQVADAWKRFTHRHTVALAPLETLGFKANYTDLQAAIARVQLRRFGELQARRSSIANYYLGWLKNAALDVVVQAGVSQTSHARHLFVIRLPMSRLRISRDEFLMELRIRNIGATLHYVPLHTMPLYRQLCGEQKLPITEELAPQILTLPISSSMTIEDAAYVCNHLEACLLQYA